MQALERFRESALYGDALAAWRWWAGELQAMVPEGLRARLAGRRHALVTPSAGAVRIDRIVDGTGETFVEGRALETFDAENWAELEALTSDCRIRLVLQPPDIHVMKLSLPKVARNRLRSAIALQLYQLAPLEPEHLIWTFETRDTHERDIVVRVAMARTARIVQLQALFDAQDLRIPPIDAQGEEGLISLVGGETRPRDPERRRVRLAYMAAAALILSIPFTSLIGAAILKATAESRIAALEAEIGPKIEAERHWRSDEALRQALMPLARLPAASPALDDLSRRLPETVYAESIEQAPDRSLLLTLSTTDAQKTLADLSKASEFPHPSLVDETGSAQAGRTTATYRTSPR